MTEKKNHYLSISDEVIPVIAKRQNGELGILNANGAIWYCLTQIMEDYRIRVFKVV